MEAIKINDLAEQLGVSYSTIYRKVKSFRKDMKSFTFKKDKAIWLKPEAVEHLKKELEKSVEPSKNKNFSTNFSENFSEKNLEKFLKTQIEKMEETIKEQRNRLEKNEDFMKRMLENQADERHRTDTIIMSLTNRLEDIQKRLPELPAPEPEVEEKKGIVKRFISWLTTPDQKPVEWDDSKIFGKAN